MPFEFVLIELGVEDLAESGKEPMENIGALRVAFEQGAKQEQGKHKVHPETYKLSERMLVPDVLNNHSIAVLCGKTSEIELQKRCEEVLEAHAWPVVLVDAFENAHDLKTAFSNLEAKYIQLARTGGLIALMKSGRNFVYAYEKSDCTATVCLLFDGGTQALVIERLHEPYAGRSAFPGGFLRVQLETLEDAAYRELEEECGLKMEKGEMVLVDVRSAPNRDPRAHIVDAGYAAVISTERKEELLKQLSAGDDASKAHLMPVEDLLKDNALAFDHGLLLVNTLRHFGLSK
jgi:ADP-ribose pyrophosphatase YjhB (NUDIX family)